MNTEVGEVEEEVVLGADERLGMEVAQMDADFGSGPAGSP